VKERPAGSTSWASSRAHEASNSSSATTRSSSSACLWPTPTDPPCFGGYRKWFRVPWVRVPVRILYRRNSLRCRRYRALKFAFQSEASHWRAQRKARSMRRRLGAWGDVLDGRSHPSLQRCAEQLANACKLSMQRYRSNGSSTRLEASGEAGSLPARYGRVGLPHSETASRYRHSCAVATNSTSRVAALPEAPF